MIQQIKLRTIDAIYEKSIKLKDADFELLNLFYIENVSSDEEAIWKWYRATLHRFMPRLGFNYDIRKPHYESSHLKPTILLFEIISWGRYRITETMTARCTISMGRNI